MRAHFRRFFQPVIVLGLCLLVAGCATGVLRNARQEFYRGEHQKAAEILANAKKISSRDKLLLYLERGTILHHQGSYEASVTELLNASRLIAEQEVISISQQASSLVTSEKITEYKGEYSERLWVHTYLMMNFLVLRKFDAALVEAKQALKVFGQHHDSLANDYFTRSLVALCYENVRDYNDAYIEYKKLADLYGSPDPVGYDLYRLARRLHFKDEAEKYKKYAGFRIASQVTGPPTEAVIFVSLGRAPIKEPFDIVLPKAIRISFPHYIEKDRAAYRVEVSTKNEDRMALSISTDVNRVAKASLDERKTQVIAKETARVLAKESIANSVGKDHGQLAESLVRMAFFVLQEADTRSWQTLPVEFVLVRVPLEPGEHELTLHISGGSGRQEQEVPLPLFTLSEGQRLYFSVRK